MAQYIDKDALVAEIEKLKKSHDNWSYMGKSFHKDYESLLSFLDTLDVKEIGVDLGDPEGDKSAKYIIDTKTLEVKEVDLEKEYEEFVVDDPIFGNFITNDTMGMELAKHFFELGMSVSIKAQKGE